MAGGHVSINLGVISSLVNEGNDCKNQLLSTTNLMTDEIRNINTYTNITGFNSKLDELTNKIAELNSTLVNSFDYINNFIDEQSVKYGQEAEELVSNTSTVSSSIDG